MSATHFSANFFYIPVQNAPALGSTAMVIYKGVGGGRKRPSLILTLLHLHQLCQAVLSLGQLGRIVLGCGNCLILMVGVVPIVVENRDATGRGIGVGQRETGGYIP